jgi:hypothetical protein
MGDARPANHSSLTRCPPPGGPDTRPHVRPLVDLTPAVPTPMEPCPQLLRAHCNAGCGRERRAREAGASCGRWTSGHDHDYDHGEADACAAGHQFARAPLSADGMLGRGSRQSRAGVAGVAGVARVARVARAAGVCGAVLALRSAVPCAGLIYSAARPPDRLGAEACHVAPIETLCRWTASG